MAEYLMETMVRTALWQQFGAAIDMLENAVVACPEMLWQEHLWSDAEGPHYGTFWEITSHTLFWLDMYLTAEPEGFASPMPFMGKTFRRSIFEKLISYFAGYDSLAHLGPFWGRLRQFLLTLD